MQHVRGLAVLEPRGQVRVRLLLLRRHKAARTPEEILHDTVGLGGDFAAGAERVGAVWICAAADSRVGQSRVVRGRRGRVRHVLVDAVPVAVRAAHAAGGHDRLAPVVVPEGGERPRLEAQPVIVVVGGGGGVVRAVLRGTRIRPAAVKKFSNKLGNVNINCSAEIQRC